MRASQLFLREIHFERLLQLLAVPLKRAQELFVIGATFVPLLEQAGRDIDALAVPRLTDHVDLAPGLLRVRLLWRFRIAEVEVAGQAVGKGVNP